MNKLQRVQGSTTEATSIYYQSKKVQVLRQRAQVTYNVRAIYEVQCHQPKLLQS